MNVLLNKWGELLFNYSEILHKKRATWIDYAKGIAIILVVYRHTYTGIGASGIEVNIYLQMVSYSISNFRMPMFFVLSGIFINKSIAKKSFKQLTISKLNTIMYPYLIWATIQVTLQILLSHYTTTPRTVRDYLYIFYEPHLLDQFWYLYTLFNVTIIYALFKSKLHFPIWFQLILGIVFFHYSRSSASGLLNDTLFFYIFFGIGDLMSGFFLKQENKPAASIPLLLLFLPLFFFSQKYWLDHRMEIAENAPLFAIIALVGCMFMFNFSFVLEKYGWAKWLRVIGNHSLYIYIMHLLAESTIRIFFVRLFHIKSAALILLVGVGAGVVLPIIFYNLTMNAGLWYLYTFKEPKKVVEKVGSY